MIILKEEFKTFVRTKPELASYVTDGSMTWQKFYELWSLYGNDNKIWDDYPKKSVTTSARTSSNSNNFSFSSIVDSLKKVDMDSVQKGINSVQKAVELLQGFTAKDALSSSSSSGYEPRQLFKRFED